MLIEKLKKNQLKNNKEKKRAINSFINKQLNEDTIFGNITKNIDNTITQELLYLTITLTVGHIIFKILKKTMDQYKKFNNTNDDNIKKTRIISFKDIAGYTTIKEELMDITEFEVKNSKNKKMTDILFYGPTGTGKTLFAQAFATEAKLPLIITDKTHLESK